MIHIFGASGAGTTTLGNSLSERIQIPHLDTDDFFWMKTDIPFTEKREVGQRVKLLKTELDRHPSWILSGSLCGWGDFAIPMFTLAVYLWIPHELRMERLRNREVARYGIHAVSPGGWFYQNHVGFMEWASQYDTAGIEMRSRALHEAWMADLPCPVLRFEQPSSTPEITDKIIEYLGIIQ